jgi:hypothetical protein
MAFGLLSCLIMIKIPRSLLLVLRLLMCAFLLRWRASILIQAIKFEFNYRSGRRETFVGPETTVWIRAAAAIKAVK